MYVTATILSVGRQRQTVATNWRAADLAWLAGVFECKGNLQRTSQGWLLTFLSTNVELIDRVADVIGFGSQAGPLDNGSDLPLFRWRSASYAVPILLARLDPLLTQHRRAQIAAAIGGIHG